MSCHPLVLSVCLLLLAGPLRAGGEAPRCPVKDHGGSTPAGVERQDAPLTFEADRLEYQAGERLSMTGRASARRADQRLTADRMDYDPARDLLRARGDVAYRATDLEAWGRSLEFSPRQDLLRMEELRYLLPVTRAHGGAKRLELRGRDRLELDDLSYTTCESARRGWELRARETRFDRVTGVGKARHVQLRFRDVPFFYAPYLSFPLDQRRKSGLLAPGFGNTEASGLELALPVYLNLAPNRDLTLTPHLYQKRGLALDGEFRYLEAKHAGELRFEYLPEDRREERRRGALSIRQQARFGQGWYGLADVGHVSDLDYFRDFGTSLEVTSQTYLDRRLELGYAGDHLRLLARMQDLQTLDGGLAAADRPYRRLPQLRMEGELPWQPAGLRLSLTGEWVRFRHEALANEGSRLDLWPRLTLPWRKPGYFLEPALGLRYTRYRLDDAEPGIDKAATRNTGIFSLDGGLWFERPLQGGVQTLEPRLFYLYVPYRDQEALPVFDTLARDFRFDDLFRENLFTGADRMNDANRLSLALTSRWLDAGGNERLRASLGRVHAFERSRVELPGTDVPADLDALLIAELQASPRQDWRVRATLQWDERQEQTRLGSIQASYRPGRGRLLNLSYRRREGILEQIDLSWLWPLDFIGDRDRRWHLMGRWNYSLRHEQNLETLAGVQYDTCCWALRAVGRRYVRTRANDVDSNDDLSLYFELELKGLAGIGRTVSSILERGILDYSQYRPEPR